jgi:hypothetical protein
MQNLIGLRVVLKKRYQGCKYGIIREVLGAGDYFGIHLAGYYFNNRPITVDFTIQELTILFHEGK